MKNTSEKQAADNRANQLNPRHPAYHLSRGASSEEAERLAAHEALGGNPASEGGTTPQQPVKPSTK
jgi:hypothetical protein